MTDTSVSRHACNQWDARTPADSVAPETAWARGQRLAALERPTGTDECRVHHATRTILLRCNYQIVTVLTPAELDHAERRHVVGVIDDEEVVA